MRILHVVGGPLSGGAARGAVYLHRALISRGLKSTLLCTDAEPQERQAFPLHKTVLIRSIKRALSKIDKIPLRLYPNRKHGLFSTAITGTDITSHELYKTADLIHLHWINGSTLSVSNIAKIDKPCVWTFRDMWPITGGCHYSLGCERYRSGCGFCPHLSSTNERDLSRYIFAQKEKLIPKHFGLVGISSWLSDCARSSPIFCGADIRTILNCVDTATFTPLDKQTAKKQLDLPLDRPILLHGALNLEDEYKGGSILEEAKDKLDASIHICTFGKFSKNGRIKSDRDFGYIGEDQALRTIYSASDVLVFPSIQEAFGKVAAESLACGTPVVAFNATGLKDIVKHEITGYAATPFDPNDLATGISWVLKDSDRRRRMSTAAAKDARDRFSPRRAALEYEQLYLEKAAESQKRP